MKYTLFYDVIKNPIDDQNVLEQLIMAYAEHKNYYSALTNRYSKNKQKSYNISACDDLYASLFNRWKRELLSITSEQYELAIKNGLYDKNIYKLLAFLKKTPDVKTKKEADNILDGDYKDKELEKAIEKYRWDSINAYSGWTHIDESYINGRKTAIPKTEHRLYINVDFKDIHKISKIFMDKCYQKKLPFYFKIGEYDIRDDNMVIYSNTKFLPHYFCILGEIEREYPDIIKRCGKPPVLSGIIRGWIGYGSEPIKMSGKESFNTIRAHLIKKAISEELIEWYKKNKNSTVQIKNKTLTLLDYITLQVTKNKIKNMLQYARKNKDKKNLKYSEQEIYSSEFINKMYNLVSMKIEEVFNNFINGKTSSVKIDIPIKDNLKTSIYSSEIIDQIKSFITVVVKNDPDFINRVRRRIKIDAINNGRNRV